MKSTSVKGTPCNFHGPAGGSIQATGNGFNPSLRPAGYAGRAGTVKDQFEGDQRGPDQVRAQSGLPPLGTPFQSQQGNPDETLITRSSGRYGVSPTAGIDLNDSNANGNGVAFDHISEARDYTPWNQPAMDSPVPDGKQMPQPDSADQLNALRNGQGKDFGAREQIPDQLLKVGGVMSR